MARKGTSKKKGKGKKSKKGLPKGVMASINAASASIGKKKAAKKKAAKKSSGYVVKSPALRAKLKRAVTAIEKRLEAK